MSRDKLYVKLELLRHSEELKKIEDFLSTYDYSTIPDQSTFGQVYFNGELHIMLKPSVKAFVDAKLEKYNCMFLLRGVSDLVKDLQDKFDSVLYSKFKLFLKRIEFLCRLERRRKLLACIKSDSEYLLDDLYAPLCSDTHTMNEACAVRFTASSVLYYSFTRWKKTSKSNIVVSFDLMNQMNLSRPIHGVALALKELKQAKSLSFCKINKNLNVDLSVLYDIIEPDHQIPDVKYYVLFQFQKYVVLITENCYFKLLINLSCFNVSLENKSSELVSYLYPDEMSTKTSSWKPVWLSVGPHCSQFSHVAVYDWVSCVTRPNNHPEVTHVKDLDESVRDELLYRQFMHK